jgi:hypothetical protein
MMRFIPPPSRGRRSGHGPEGGSLGRLDDSIVSKRPPSGRWGGLLPREGGGIGGF